MVHTLLLLGRALLNTRGGGIIVCLAVAEAGGVGDFTF